MIRVHVDREKSIKSVVGESEKRAHSMKKGIVSSIQHGLSMLQ